MSLVIKRSKKTSSEDLLKAIEEFCVLLADQKEEEAITDLKAAAAALSGNEPDSDAHKKAIATVIDAFEGDHELMAYTVQSSKDLGSWNAADQLSAASSRVLSLARRMAR